MFVQNGLKIIEARVNFIKDPPYIFACGVQNCYIWQIGDIELSKLNLGEIMKVFVLKKSRAMHVVFISYQIFTEV